MNTMMKLYMLQTNLLVRQSIGVEELEQYLSHQWLSF
jgi:hypothetical protein